MKRILFSAVYTIIQRMLFHLVPRRQNNAREVRIIYKPDAIGDFVLATGAIREIHKREDRPWVLITSPAVADFACEQFPGLEVVSMRGAYDQGLRRFWNHLTSLRPFVRDNRVDTLLCLRHAHNGFDQVILHWLSPRFSLACIDSPIYPPLASSCFYPPPSGSFPGWIPGILSLLTAFLLQLMSLGCIYPTALSKLRNPIQTGFDGDSKNGRGT